MDDSRKTLGSSNVNPRQILTHANIMGVTNAGPSLNGTTAVTIGQNASNLPSMVGHASRHHQHQSHYQVHQQMFMDRVRGVPLSNQTNDFYYSEMHSTWQYSAPQFYASIPPPGASASNVPLLPNLSVPPPPYGVFPVGSAGPIYAGYATAAFQSNAGFIGPNGAMVTNTVGAVGAVSAFGGQMFAATARSASCSGSSAGSRENTSSCSNSSSTTSSASARNPLGSPFRHNGAVPRPTMHDVATQTDMIRNVPPLEKLNISCSTSLSLSSSTQMYANCKELLDIGTSLSSTNSSCGGGGAYAGAGDSGDFTSPLGKEKSRKNAEVQLSQQKLHDMTRVSLRGSEIAEKLAYVHRNRPCFKKIDSLCARMKQDLIRPDGVLPNINSQGIAWAVKDYIFVFTRIVNAWIIMKGYIYNTPDGLNKIKNVLPEGFMDAFSNWQDTTLIFIEVLVKSFLCLDNLVQKQKTSFSKTENSTADSGGGSCNNNNNNNNSSNENNKSGTTESGSNSPNRSQTSFTNIFDENFSMFHRSSKKSVQEGLKKNYMYTMVEDSEETQRNVNANGTYFKTGTYQPLQKTQEDPDSSSAEQAGAANIDPKVVNAIDGISNVRCNVGDGITIGIAPTEEYMEMNLKSLKSLNLSFLDPEDELQAPKVLGATPWPVTEQTTKGSSNVRLNPSTVFGRDIIKKLNQLSDRILHLNNIEVFFKKEFTKNYYPDFISKCKYDYIDLRQIVLKCQNAQYSHLYEAVHDLKRISYVAKSYLQLFENMNLKTAIMKYETEINYMLGKPPYIPHQFDHISGKPNEKLFNYNI